MATYKVIQDIEAEDHIVGNLSLRQFIYAIIAAFSLYISFLCVTKGVAFMVVLTLPPAILFGFLAFPFGRDQPTEVWALAKIRFLIKPHKRIWNQSGVKEIVTVNVPKKIELQRTDGLNQMEVKSRLRALADTIDSRGWAIKNINVNMYSQPDSMSTVSDRLVEASSMPVEVPSIDIRASDDILDDQSSPLAQHMNQMIAASTTAHRQQLIQQLQASATPPANNAVTTPHVVQQDWFATQPAQPLVSVQQPQSITPADEAALMTSIRQRNDAQKVTNSHLRTLQPTPSDPLQPLPDNADTGRQAPVSSEMTRQSDPAILSLANNNDLNVATLAREAGKAHELDESHDEVVISLH